MCDHAIYYNGTQLWTHWDSDISSNTLNFEFFTYQSDKQSRLQAPKYKFVIYSQSSNSSSVTLFNSELYKYIYNVKKTIVDRLNTHIDKINNDKNYTDGFVFKTKRNSIYTTILYNNLIDSPCIRFMIGEKEQMLVDTDKVYIPLIEFTSLFLTMNKSFDNYCVMSQNIMMMDQFKKYSELMEEKLLDLSIKLEYNNRMESTNPYNYIIGPVDRSLKYKGEVVEKPIIDDPEEFMEKMNSIRDKLSPSIDSMKIILDSRHKQTESVIDNENETDIVVENKQQSDFDSFLVDKRDSFQLDLPEEDKKEENNKSNNTQKEIIHENFFRKQILKNDFTNLEVIIRNCVNSKLPVTSFVNTVYELSGIDLYNGFEENDKYCLNYAITNNLRFNINQYLNKKIELPKSINPVIVKDKINTQEKIDTVCFLLLSYIYLSKVKNDLEGIDNPEQNKSFISYSLKTITSPFVFSHILDMNKEVLVACMSKLYNELYTNKFFDKFNQDIFEKTHKSVDFNTTYLSEQVERIYDNVQKFKDKLIISNFFNKKFMKLTYNDVNTIVGKYNPDTMTTILNLEYNKEIKSTEGLTDVILEKYGLKEKKFDNSIIVRYINTKYPNFKDIEQIKNINVSSKDIINKIDINGYPLDILKALYFWNVEFLDKNITYDGFVKMIENSNLTEQELISMILHNNYKKDNSFYNSLNICINE